MNEVQIQVLIDRCIKYFRDKLALAINGQVIGEWFKEQFGRLFSSVKRTVEPLRRGKGMGLQTIPAEE